MFHHTCGIHLYCRFLLEIGYQNLNNLHCNITLKLKNQNISSVRWQGFNLFTGIRSLYFLPLHRDKFSGDQALL